MTTRWEYLSLVWQKAVEKKTTMKDAVVEPPEPEEHWSYAETIYLWRPGAEEAEVHRGWSTDEPDRRTDTLRLLNELGADGWELVGRAIQSSSVGKSRLGWTTAGWPVEIVWTMKREIS